jgi:hypothetical protein
VLRHCCGECWPDSAVAIPVWAAGATGAAAAAASVADGAAGVVLDSQLSLMPESDLPGHVNGMLRQADASTSVAGSFAARWPGTAAAARAVRDAIIAARLDDDRPDDDRPDDDRPDDDRPDRDSRVAADRPLDIAIVGMAGTFAGSASMTGFWNTILSGEDVLTEVPAERWNPAIYYAADAAQAIPGRHTVSKWGGFLPLVAIDPIRFGIPPSALGSIEPSQLLALEVADRAMADAGCSHDTVGVDHSRWRLHSHELACPGCHEGVRLARR